MLFSLQINSYIQSLKSNTYFIFGLALFVVPLSGLGIDIYVPSLPAISQHFGVDKSLAQLSITFYMVGLGLMQLFAGSLSDSYGRRQPFLIAMSAFILATFFIPFSHNINQLLFLRFVQGSLVAMIVVPMRSVLNDLFQGSQYLKMSNYMFLAWSMGPIIAPMIGGYTQHYFGWQASFYLLLLYSIVAFGLIFVFMPETSRCQYPLHLKTSIKRYQEMLCHKEYFRGLIMNCLLYSLIIIFAVVGPFLIENVMHYSAVEFGHVALLMGLAWFLGGLTNRFLFQISFRKKAKCAFLSMLLITVLTLMADFIMPINLYLVVIPNLLLLYLGGIVFPNNFAKATALFPKTSGSANALFGAIIFLVAGISSGFAVLLKANSQTPMIMTYLIIVICCLSVARLKIFF